MAGSVPASGSTTHGDQKAEKILKTLKEAQGRMNQYEPSIDYEEMATDMGDLLEAVIPEMQEALKENTKPIFVGLLFHRKKWKSSAYTVYQKTWILSRSTFKPN